MITPRQIIEIAAADMNDSAQRVYNWTTLRPYLNIALMELMQIFEENNLPITRKNSAIITVPEGETDIAYQGTVAVLPSDLIEIENMYESSDQNSWAKVSLVDSINPNIATGANLTYFGTYAWMGDRIQVPAVVGTRYLKLQYSRNIVPLPLTTAQEDLPLQLKTPLFLGHKTAALAASLVTQNETRAAELNELADQALGREVNISVKPQQKLPVRRRPFRAGWKSIGRIY